MGYETIRVDSKEETVDFSGADARNPKRKKGILTRAGRWERGEEREDILHLFSGRRYFKKRNEAKDDISHIECKD
jgi:hypothetical protein